jgi:NADP-dependent 3-hydroxy acid dehydrogenase YdfG
MVHHIQSVSHLFIKERIMSKTILITGASTGFGRDTAETLARQGHRVFASMRHPETKNRIHAEVLRTSNIEVIELDVTDSESVDQAVAAVIEKAGRIDVLINNAGVLVAGVSEAISPEQVKGMFDVNVIGVHRVTRAVLPHLRDKKDGLIINIGSVLGRVTFPFFGLYGASKFAVEAMTDSYRYEVSQLGIDVTLIQPSGYPTQLFDSSTQPADTRRVTEYGPVGKIPDAIFHNLTTSLSGPEGPDPHEVAEAIANIIDTPKGDRPDRIVVGESYGADEVNQSIKPIQRATVDALGLGRLDTVKDLLANPV